MRSKHGVGWVYGGHISVIAITKLRTKVEFASARVTIDRAFYRHCLFGSLHVQGISSTHMDMPIDLEKSGHNEHNMNF